MKNKKELQDEFDSLFSNRFSKQVGNNNYENLRDAIIGWAISIPIEPPVMQWRTRDEKPIPSKRIIIFSPCYPEESDMRKRIITGQFLGLCTEATHWSYIGEPSA